MADDQALTTYSSEWANKTILVTGGTGTVGSALVRELLACNPRVIRVFSRDEHKQFELQQELGRHKNVRFLLGDVRDRERLLRATEEVDVVFHTAALKHLPACEYNPFEAVKTNVLGTQHVIDAALHHNVERVIYTSSDKAISPTNAMGATKLLAERLISATNYARGNKQTVFTVVRFGNIIASRGSVIPLFMKQIASQGPVTVTCAGMTRFMMSIDQAVRLALEAARLAQGGEVFVLKMPALRLGDLVRVLIAEYAPRCGLQPEDIPVKEIGLRPGEKMHEELMHADEALEAVELARLFVIPSSFSEREHAYPEGQPAQSRSYSSGEQVLLNERQIRDLLCGTGVLPCPANTDSSTMLQATASNIPIHG